MPRRRARNTEGQFLGDDPVTSEVNEAWVESPAPMEEIKEVEAPVAEQEVAAPADFAPITPSEEPKTAPEPASKQEIETDVKKKLAKKTDSEQNPFVPQNSAVLEKEAKKVAEEKGFDLNRGTSIGARLMARRLLG